MQENTKHKPNIKTIIMIALPALLLLALLAVLSYDSLAAYVQTKNLESEAIYAKKVNFYINGSDSVERTLEGLSVEPDGSASWELVLDARGTETELDAALGIDINSNKAFPPGFTVSINGESAASGKTLEFPSIEKNSPQTVTITLDWDVSGNASAYPEFARRSGAGQGSAFGYFRDANGNALDLSGYDGFSLNAVARVAVEQRGGGTVWGAE